MATIWYDSAARISARQQSLPPLHDTAARGLDVLKGANPWSLVKFYEAFQDVSPRRRRGKKTLPVPPHNQARPKQHRRHEPEREPDHANRQTAEAADVQRRDRADNGVADRGRREVGA